MSDSIRNSLLGAITRLLRPLVRILLRNGVPYGTFADLAKRVYVDLAADECGLPGRKQSISRISILTGLSRKEVRRVLSLPAGHRDDGGAERYNRAARVITGWVRDADFTDTTQHPLDLPMDGTGATFTALTKRFSGDVPARAILDELLHVGAVERVDNDTFHLVHHAYLPTGDEASMLDILGTDVHDLIATIDHNLRRKDQAPFFQRKVSYDNLPTETIDELQQLVVAKGQACLEEIDRWMAPHDRDINPAVRGSGQIRAGFGMYYFKEDIDTGRTES